MAKTNSDVDQKLKAMGYEQPSNLSYHPQNNVYMSYTSGDYKSQTYDPYATFNAEEAPPAPASKPTPTSKPAPASKPANKNCPVCQHPAKYICNCNLAEQMCANRHKWFWQKGQLIIADPHEDEN
jgi:hypothetical protein